MRLAITGLARPRQVLPLAANQRGLFDWTPGRSLPVKRSRLFHQVHTELFQGDSFSGILYRGKLHTKLRLLPKAWRHIRPVSQRAAKASV
jgi:hypothetical protein